MDACVFPTILLPYTFPAFQVGPALPLQLQDQPECAYMVARSFLYATILILGYILLPLLSCLHWCTTHFIHCYFWLSARCPGPWTSSSSATCPAPNVSPLRQCLRPFQILRRQFLFLLCVGCLLQTRTCTRTGPGEREVTAVVGRGSAPPNVQALPATGRLPTAAAEQTHIPPQKSSTKSYWSSCPEPSSIHSLQGTPMHL